MEFEWDERKRRANLQKHQIDFAIVEPMFAGRIVGTTIFVTTTVSGGSRPLASWME